MVNAMTVAEFAVVLFTALNVGRVFAYLPQILRIAHDRHGAEAISCVTWILFALSHLSTVLYAVFVLGDTWMAWIFAANLLACISVLGLTACKRAASQAGCSGATSCSPAPPPNSCTTRPARLFG